LASFDATSGRYPFGTLIADAKGNFFGTTTEGGAYGAVYAGLGTVFEIAKTTKGYASTPNTLVSFNGTNGAIPWAGLIADADGNLFGTTQLGGIEYDTTKSPSSNAYGTVFEIAKTAKGYASTPATLITFTGNSGPIPGAYPSATLLADADGNLFGTRGAGGAFEIVKTADGYASTPISFDINTDGSFAGLTADANGNLFGTTWGSGPYGSGFEIAKTANGYASTAIVLASFDGTAGRYPYGGLIADANGNLFGTTNEGGANGYGTVFEIAKTAKGYASTPNTLVSFNGTNGAYPYASLIADADGNLFGTTFDGGEYGDGTVFEITGSGFVPPRRFAGTPGKANCLGKSVSALAQQYGGLNKCRSGAGLPQRVGAAKCHRSLLRILTLAGETEPLNDAVNFIDRQSRAQRAAAGCIAYRRRRRLLLALIDRQLERPRSRHSRA
jgi:uncharacterized repeat protein (TIGR03803 family)